MKYWRVILSAASIDSEPPHVNHALREPAGASDTRSLASASIGSLEKKRVCANASAIDLRLDRVSHARVAVSEARHRRAAGAVEVALAVGVDRE